QRHLGAHAAGRVDAGAEDPRGDDREQRAAEAVPAVLVVAPDRREDDADRDRGERRARAAPDRLASRRRDPRRDGALARGERRGAEAEGGAEAAEDRDHAAASPPSQPTSWLQKRP